MAGKNTAAFGIYTSRAGVERAVEELKAAGYRNSDIWALRAGGRGDVSTSNLLWRMPNGGSYAPSIVQYQGLLYMTNEVGVVTCAAADTGNAMRINVEIVDHRKLKMLASLNDQESQSVTVERILSRPKSNSRRFPR